MNKIKRIVEEAIPGYVWLAEPRSKVWLAETAAREARQEAEWQEHLKKHPPLDLRHVAINVVAIPLFPEDGDEIFPKQERTHMATELTTVQKIAKLKADPAVKSLTATGRPGAFNPNLFSPATATAIQAANEKNKFLPDTPRQDFDDRSVSSDSSSVSAAADYLNCELSGQSGCPHGDCDHVEQAKKCLANVDMDERMRTKTRRDASKKAVGVRFQA